MRIKIGNRWVGDGEPVYIIAEIGSNHDGSLEQAKKMIDYAKEIGADAAKFQSFLADKIVSRTGFKKKISFQARWSKPVWQVYKDAELPREWHKILADHCKKRKIHFLSSSWDEEAVDLLDELDVPAFKIGSGDITNLPLVKYTARKHRPIILATGASTLDEIRAAVNTIKRAGNKEIILLHCVVNYPSPIEDANIRAMITLRETFRCPVGYSDHTESDIVPLGAVALGACMIEKHFTIDRSRPGPDHPYAMEVPEFAGMVKKIRLLERALGSPIKRVTPSEK
ncbi:MAG: N-acetylneuraminate synthase family protein, partial [Candidatus Hadarchaeum sp.]